MPVRVALVARTNRRDIDVVYADDALDASARSAALHIARLALPVVELDAAADAVQCIPCESRHSFYARVDSRAALIFALLASHDVDERLAAQTLARIATQLDTAAAPPVDPVALQRVLKAAVDHANAAQRHQAHLARLARANAGADELALHLRDETIPLIIDRGEKIESLLDRTESISSAGAPFRSVSAAAAAVVSRPRPFLCYQSIKFVIVIVFIAAIIAYVVAAAFCGGLLLHRCVGR